MQHLNDTFNKSSSWSSSWTSVLMTKPIFFTDNKKNQERNVCAEDGKNVIKEKKNNKPIRVKSCEPQKRLRKWKNIHFLYTLIQWRFQPKIFYWFFFSYTLELYCVCSQTSSNISGVHKIYAMRVYNFYRFNLWCKRN